MSKAAHHANIPHSLLQLRIPHGCSMLSTVRRASIAHTAHAQQQRATQLWCVGVDVAERAFRRLQCCPLYRAHLQCRACDVVNGKALCCALSVVAVTHLQTASILLLPYVQPFGSVVRTDLSGNNPTTIGGVRTSSCYTCGTQV